MEKCDWPFLFLNVADVGSSVLHPSSRCCNCFVFMREATSRTVFRLCLRRVLHALEMWNIKNLACVRLMTHYLRWKTNSTTSPACVLSTLQIAVDWCCVHFLTLAKMQTWSILQLWLNKPWVKSTLWTWWSDSASTLSHKNPFMPTASCNYTNTGGIKLKWPVSDAKDRRYGKHTKDAGAPLLE